MSNDYCDGVPEQKYERCSPSFCKKIFSAHRRIAAASLENGSGCYSWSKISTRERKCDKQSVALWTLCEALFFRGHCGVTLENSFFSCNPKSLKLTTHTVFENPKTVSFNIASEASYVYILSDAKNYGQMKHLG